ncbi:MAG: single-stranded DNA-binding protein [Patescibacteria group bacterium]|nr:single-stranded DNA-binding protein [Patescibacteria group bacterium]
MPMSLNRAQIIGNLTRDPELRNTSNGQSVTNFSVATSSQWTDVNGQKQERTEYHSIVAWGKLAEICNQYLGKGRKVFVEGRLQTRDWETPDGQKRQRTEIIAENMIMLDKAPAGGGAPFTPSTPQSPTVEPEGGAVDQGVGDQEIRVEDIPF